MYRVRLAWIPDSPPTYPPVLWSTGIPTTDWSQEEPRLYVKLAEDDADLKRKISSAKSQRTTYATYFQYGYHGTQWHDWKPSYTIIVERFDGTNYVEIQRL